jgi:serine/threonine-protein kinase HipA
VTTATVRLWGSTIGAVSLAEGEPTAVFQYDPAFLSSGIEVAPLVMPLDARRYAFPGLGQAAFHGLPGLLADSLPDRFGNALIDTWLAAQGRTSASFDAVERLCYTGSRGMGALEFAPARGPRAATDHAVDVAALTRLATAVLTERDAFTASLAQGERRAAMREILRVGTSAGGARAKAVIAWNPATNEVRSGQVDPGSGFEHWLLKLDGVDGNRDRELDDPRGFGAIEYAYHRMAVAAGVEMAECRLLAEGGRRHFLTRRFDRTAAGGRLHMQTLGALCHYDLNEAGAHSYEEALLVIRRLGLGMQASEQQFRRLVFNIVARNQDDHVKNIAFLMDRAGRWSLAPAFDVTYAYNPDGAWTGRHQMSANGRRDGFTIDDLRAVAAGAAMRRGTAERVAREVTDAVLRWPTFAVDAGVDERTAARIAAAHRLDLDPR